MPARTKAGEHDDSLAFGHSAGNVGGQPWVATLLKKLAQVRKGHLFPISLPRYEYLMRVANGSASLSKLRLTPHCARHGAASAAFASGRLDLKQIQKKGRWKAFASVRTYEKSSKLVKQMNKMSVQQLRLSKQLAATLPRRLIAELC